MRVACYYNVNQTTSFRLRQRRSEPYADNARGELLIEIRLATGEGLIHHPRTRKLHVSLSPLVVPDSCLLILP